MSYTAEKIYFVVASGSASALSLIGAIMNEGDARFAYVTLAVSLVTAALCALGFKARREKMPKVVARTGFAILGGVFGTRFAQHKGWLPDVHGDVLLLGWHAIIVTVVSFFVVFWVLHFLNRRGKALADRLLRNWAPDGE